MGLGGRERNEKKILSFPYFYVYFFNIKRRTTEVVRRFIQFYILAKIYQLLENSIFSN